MANAAPGPTLPPSRPSGSSSGSSSRLRASRAGIVFALAALWSAPAIGYAQSPPFALAADTGYRGIWYANQKTGDEYSFKYSGGMATYPQQHVPIAIHVPSVRKTFFVYGGTDPDRRSLLHMVSFFDHATGTVPRPRILLDKETLDAHDNPTLTIDARGFLWIFSNAHGTARPSYIHRSAEPYSIDSFQLVRTTNFSYAQPWVRAGGDFFVLHTRYQRGRGLFWMTSADGWRWSEPQSLAHIEQGHYQVSASDGRHVASAFNFHPDSGGLNARTNLYYLQTPDGGRSWQTASGAASTTPVTQVDHPALIHDYRSQGLLVYLKELQFDLLGRPVILYLTSRGHAPGPASGPRTWRIARWVGERWAIKEVTTSDHNYDFGSLYLEPDGVWRLIAPTDPGAQPFGTGGAMVLWISGDEGETWTRVKTLTHDPKFNHSYARRPLDAHPDFYALWGTYLDNL